jgi:hypothetical protein
MRPALMLGGILGVLVTELAAPAQTPDKRVVIAREVLVRCGPSEKYYSTGRLNYGEQITVVPQPPGSQQAGWLAIVPPRGSFSWINQRFVKEIQPGTGEVIADTPVPILVGSSEVKDEPNKEALQAKRGSQVVIMGAPNYTDKGVWLPILPQPGEVRYIPESAVQALPVSPALAASSPGPRPAPGIAVVAPTPVPANNNDEVAQSLQKAAAAETDPARKNQILQVLASRTAGSSVIAAAAPAGGSSSLYAGTAATTAPYAAPAKWTDYGTLRRTAYQEADGRPVYALEDTRGNVLTYATPAPGKQLEMYVGQKLTLYGPSFYNQNIRKNEITATFVYALAQNRY